MGVLGAATFGAQMLVLVEELRMVSKSRSRIERQFDRIQRKVPVSARLLEWLRRPGARLVRVPLGLLLVLGGIFSFLPVLGIWMLPLGLLLLALDISLLRTPVSSAIVRGSRKWQTWRRRRRTPPPDS